MNEILKQLSDRKSIRGFEDREINVKKNNRF